MIDLWPNELSTVDQRSPLTILKEQASLLGEKTQNIVIAALENTPRIGHSPVRMRPFRYRFVLTCPALGNYRFRLFSIGYGIYMYPVYFDLDSDVAQEIIEKTHVEPAKGWDPSGIERGGIHRDPEAHLQFQESCTGHSCTTFSGQVLKDNESPLGSSLGVTTVHPKVTSTRASSLGVRSMSTASPSSGRSMISSHALEAKKAAVINSGGAGS